MQTNPLPKSVARLTSVDGFIESYQEKLKNTKTCKEAYLKAEEEYRILFGKPKYSSHGTFRNALARWNDKRLKNLKKKK